VKHIAAGHGFSVCGGKKDKNSSYILGTGINTDSQLGYHSQGGKFLCLIKANGVFLRYNSA